MNRRDRSLLAACAACVVLLALVIALVAPAAAKDDPVPSSYSTGAHGALAAYLLLQRSGYRVERWTAPFQDLTRAADAHTTVLIADPLLDAAPEARDSVKKLLAQGARVIVTGFSGGSLAPETQITLNPLPGSVPCLAQANGFAPLAASGTVRIAAEAFWKQADPRQHADYFCFGQPVVVTYPYARGEVIWWASAAPLENGLIEKAGNLSLLLNSIGPRAATRVIWDESLHGEQPGLWSYAGGTPVPLLWAQLALVGALLVFSFSRRSGPLRPDPVVSRAAPLEFTRSLGALYRKAGAGSLAVSVAYAGFRSELAGEAGVPLEADADQAAALAAPRLGIAAAELAATLQAAAEARSAPSMSEKTALGLVQLLYRYQERLRLHLYATAKD